MKKVLIAVLLTFILLTGVIIVSANVGVKIGGNGYQCLAGVENRWKVESGNTATLPDGYSFEKVVVKAGQECIEVYPTNERPECYEAIIIGQDVTVNQLWEDSSGVFNSCVRCRDISHLEGVYSVENTPTPTSTNTPTDEPTPTSTNTPTNTPTEEPTPTVTNTPTEEPTPTVTETPPTEEPTPTVTETPPTVTPTVTETPKVPVCEWKAIRYQCVFESDNKEETCIDICYLYSFDGEIPYASLWKCGTIPEQEAGTEWTGELMFKTRKRSCAWVWENTCTGEIRWDTKDTLWKDEWINVWDDVLDCGDSTCPW